MKLLCWNIQNGGVRSRTHPDLKALYRIGEVVAAQAPDVGIFEEFQYQYFDILWKSLQKCGYTHISFCPDLAQKTARNGVLLFSKTPFVVDPARPKLHEYFLRNWQAAYFPEAPLWVLGVHVPDAFTRSEKELPGKIRAKIRFLQAISHFVGLHKDECPLLVAGDFNLSPGAVGDEFLDEFARVLTPVVRPAPTWYDRQLDYIFANDLLQKNVFSMKKPKLTRWSDHAYLTVEWQTPDRL